MNYIGRLRHGLIYHFGRLAHVAEFVGCGHIIIVGLAGFDAVIDEGVRLLKFFGYLIPFGLRSVRICRPIDPITGDVRFRVRREEKGNGRGRRRDGDRRRGRRRKCIDRLHANDRPLLDYQSSNPRSDEKRQSAFLNRYLLNAGVAVSPTGLGALSTPMTRREVDELADALESGLRAWQRGADA